MKNQKQPLYLAIYSDIREKTAKNTYTDGDYLPSERKLCDEYGVERATVRHALGLLAEKGIIEKVPGAGSKATARFSKEQNPSKIKNIVFVLPKGIDRITSPFISSVFYNFEKECRVNGFSLFYMNISSEDSAELEKFADSSEMAVFFGSFGKSIRDAADKLGLKYIIVSDFTPESISVVVDNITGISLAVGYLKSLGHRQIAFINGNSSRYNDAERYRGFISSMYREKLTVSEDLVMECAGTSDSGYECAMRLRNETDKFTALVAANDMIALGAMRRLAHSD